MTSRTTNHIADATCYVIGCWWYLTPCDCLLLMSSAMWLAVDGVICYVIGCSWCHLLGGSLLVIYSAIWLIVDIFYVIGSWCHLLCDWSLVISSAMRLAVSDIFRYVIGRCWCHPQCEHMQHPLSTGCMLKEKSSKILTFSSVCSDVEIFCLLSLGNHSYNNLYFYCYNGYLKLRGSIGVYFNLKPVNIV